MQSNEMCVYTDTNITHYSERLQSATFQLESTCAIPTDMSVGTIDIAYTGDIPRCWHDGADIM